MKSNRLFVFLAMLVLAVVFAGSVVAPAYAAPAIPVAAGTQMLLQESTPLVDWGKVLEQILVAVLPVIATAITVQIIVVARYYWQKIQAERPDIVAMIDRAANFVVPIIEQLKKNGTIPDNETAKSEAIKLAKRVLVEWGVEMRLVDLYVDLIAHAVEGAVNDMNKDKLVLTGEFVSPPTAPPSAG